MRALPDTTGSPFGRAVRIGSDEFGFDNGRREEVARRAVEERAAATPTLQGPALRESGPIAEDLTATDRLRPEEHPPLALHAYRPGYGGRAR